MVSVFDSISRWSIIVLCALLPFFFVPIQWITVPESKMLLVTILLALAALFWALATFAKGELRIPASVTLATGVLLPLAYAVSAGVAGWSSLSLVGSAVEQDTFAVALVCFGALTLPALTFTTFRGAAILCLRALFVGAFVLVVLQIVHIITPALPLSQAFAGQTGNALGSWHEFAIALGFFLVLALALNTTPVAGQLFRYLLHTVALLCILLLIVASFFDVWAAIGASALLFLIYRIFGMGRAPLESIRDWRRHGVWVALIAICVFFMAFGTTIGNALPAPLRVANFEVRPSWQGTVQVGRQALSSTSALLFGVGPNTFTRTWGLYKPAGVNQTQFWNTDFNAGVGSIPTSFVTIGIFGVLAWALFIAALLGMAGKMLLRPSSHPSASIYLPLVLASLYLLSFHILYVPGPALNVLTFLSVGLLVGLLVNTGGMRVRAIDLYSGPWGPARIAGLVVFSLAVVFACAGISRATVSEVLVNRSVSVYSATQDIQRSSELVADALRVYPSDDRAHRAGVELGLLQLAQMIGKNDTGNTARAELQATLEATIQHGLTAVSINSGGYQNWLELALLYQNLAGAKVTGAYDNARAAYEKAQADNPTSPLPFFNLAQLELLQNNASAALHNLSIALAMKPDFAAAQYLRSQIYASQNDIKNASAAAGEAVRSAPDDPLVWYNLGAILYVGGNYTDAAAAEEQALARNPRYANALYVEGLAYYQLGRPADALSAFESLDRLDPGQAVVARVLANLKAGKAPLPQVRK